MLAIHPTKGSFSDQWIAYCELNGISYRLVNCYDNDIIEQTKDCDVILWHYHHSHSRDVLFAKQLLYSLESAGKQVFPNFNTAWHFNDKIGQKYLFESLTIPSVPTVIFYHKSKALQWAKETNFPKVFKLRSGAGSINVRLVRDQASAVRLINKAFGKGFNPYPPMVILQEGIRNFSFQTNALLNLGKAVVRLFKPSIYSRIAGRERGYVYFQDFVPNNPFDIRVIIINGKAISIRRRVRKNDFRASGSGHIEYPNEFLSLRILKLAFQSYAKLKAQSVAFDFLCNEAGTLLITEISYGFALNCYTGCTGYWDEHYQWSFCQVDLCGWQLENVLQDEKI